MIELNDELVKILGMPTKIRYQIAERLDQDKKYNVPPSPLGRSAYVTAWFLNMHTIFGDERYERECKYALEQCDLNRPRIIT